MVVFEDNELAPISGCISYLLGSDVYFTAGNRNIIPRFAEWYKEDQLNIVYIDVVPDNDETVSQYKEVKEAFQLYNNVKIIPIPCIEYFVFQMLVKLKQINLPEVILRKGAYWHEPNYKGEESFELYCKAFLKSGRKCIWNRKRFGLFYKGDCVHTYCTNQYKYDRELKAQALIRSLPVVTSDCSENNASSIDVDSIVQKSEEVLLQWAEDYFNIGRITKLQLARVTQCIKGRIVQSNPTVDKLNELVKELHS